MYNVADQYITDHSKSKAQQHQRISNSDFDTLFNSVGSDFAMLAQLGDLPGEELPSMNIDYLANM